MSQREIVSLRLDFDFSAKKIFAYARSAEDQFELPRSASKEDLLFSVDFSKLTEANRNQPFVNMLFAACASLGAPAQLNPMSEQGWQYLIGDFRKQAELGHADAMYTLAGLLAEYSITAKDLNMLDEAEEWFEKAAAQNHHIAGQYLSDVWPDAKVLYRNMITGEDRNPQ